MTSPYPPYPAARFSDPEHPPSDPGDDGDGPIEEDPTAGLTPYPYPPYPAALLLPDVEPDTEEEPAVNVSAAITLIAGYRDHLVATIETLDKLAASIRQRHGVAAGPLQRGDRVRLSDGYPEHVDNVGAARIGRWLSRGTGDWEGYVMVDFTESGGRKTRVPDSAVTPA